MLFFWLLQFIIQYISLLILAYFNIHHLETYPYHYTIDNRSHEATIYKLNPRSDKIMLFLSGGYNLECHACILKTMLDLQKYHSPFIDTYEMICFENTTVSSLNVYDDVAQFIRKLDNEQKLKELIIVGFSSGGVVASHIMYRLNDLTHFSKKIITYDTPWQIRDNVLAFSSNTYYRLDTVFYAKVHFTYSRHYNVSEIQPYLKHKHWINGAEELLEIIRNVHGYDEEKMAHETGFHLGISPEVVVLNLYSKRDPIVHRPSHDAHYTRIQNQIQFPVVFIEKNATGHCSDMCFSTAYLKQLVDAIQYVHPTS